MPRKPLKALPTFGVRGYLGTRGATMVRGILLTKRGVATVRVQWSEKLADAPPDEAPRRRSRDWDDTPANRDAARAYGTTLHAKLERRAAGVVEPTPPTAPVTVRQLFQAYKAAEFDHLRPKARLRYAQRWDKFELFVGPTKLAKDVALGTLDDFRNALRTLPTGARVKRGAPPQIGHAIEQIRRMIADVRMVFRWGVQRDLLPPTKVVLYRVKRAKDDIVHEIGEYTPAEAQGLLAALDPRDPRRWRAYVATVLFAFAGPRQHAALHLEWRDVEFVSEDVAFLHWRPELDKQGKDRYQPVARAAVEALRVAYGWRCAYGYDGPYVFFAPGMVTREYRGQRHHGRDGRWVESAALRAQLAAKRAAGEEAPYSYQAYWRALKAAETRAGVTPQKYRAAHGFRRLVVGNLLEATGNLVQAGAYVGDSDLKVLRRSYVKDRPEQLQHLAELSQARLAPKDGAR